MTDIADSVAETPLADPPLAVESLPTQPSGAHTHPDAHSNASSADNTWRALGHYAIGELSVGRTQNALYAYRLLNALEPFEARWTLGKAFCALNLRWTGEAQKALDSVSTTSRLTSPAQENLLRQCQERLAYLQRQKSTASVATRPQNKRRGDVGKVLRFPHAARS